jgi:hypothetical protein
MIYIPSFIKIGSGIEKLMQRDTHTDTWDGKVFSLTYFRFFKIRKWYQKWRYESRKMDSAMLRGRKKSPKCDECSRYVNVHIW